MLIAMSFAWRAVAGDLPDSNLTPGATTNVPISILCKHGYTASKGVRHVSEATRQAVFVHYFGRVPDRPGDYEIDHLISLELGGSNSISNLWPQSYITVPFNAHVKDRLENKLAANVRQQLAKNGEQSAQTLLKQYQQEIATNWIAAYHKYVSSGP
jgi:hypothetical protein